MPYAPETDNPPSIGIVNATVTNSVRNPDDPLRALALSYAPEAARAGVVALLALDGALGNVVRTTSEPMVGRMRLAWWREALERLDTMPAPAEPVLQGLSDHVVGRNGITGDRLARMVLAWEWLLESPLELTALRMHAALRGELFDTIAMLCGSGPGHRANRAGRGWAFADLGTNLRDPALTARAQAMALRRIGRRGVWPRPLRVLGAMTVIARADLRGRRGAGLVGRLAWLRLTGR